MSLWIFPRDHFPYPFFHFQSSLISKCYCSNILYINIRHFLKKPYISFVNTLVFPDPAPALTAMFLIYPGLYTVLRSPHIDSFSLSIRIPLLCSHSVFIKPAYTFELATEIFTGALVWQTEISLLILSSMLSILFLSQYIKISKFNGLIVVLGPLFPENKYFYSQIFKLHVLLPQYYSRTLPTLVIYSIITF